MSSMRYWPELNAGVEINLPQRNHVAVSDSSGERSVRSSPREKNEAGKRVAEQSAKAIEAKSEQLEEAEIIRTSGNQSA